METFNPREFWEKRLTGKTNLAGVGYTKLGEPFNRWAYKIRRYVFLREIKKIFPHHAPGNILDIGSGTGFYISLWNNFGSTSVTGSDITQTSVDFLKRTFPGNHFFQMDIGTEITVNFSSGFDAISCMDVLFHIVDDTCFDKAVNNISNLLKPDGYFFYSDNFLHKKKHQTTHQVSRTKDELIDRFSSAGLSLISRRPFMVLMNSPVDTSNPLLKLYWYLTEQTLYLFPSLGHIAGPLLFFMDCFLIRMMKEGPTTEIAVFKKI